MTITEFAKQLAIDAGALIQQQSHRNFNVEEKTSKYDLVTEVDKMCEDFIKEKIAQAYPSHQVIGEESIEELDNLSLLENSDQYLWIIDPIDGTTNFVHGLPGYTVSIALMYQKEFVLGVVYEPHLQELFWAEKGKGAYCHNKQLTVTETDDIEKSLLSTGFPSDIEHARKKVIEGINQIGLRSNNIRSFGSAALHLAYVGAGRLEGYWEYGLNIWDVAAGYLIVKEAGGKVTDISGEPFTTRTKDILASNGKIHDSFYRSLNERSSNE